MPDRIYLLAISLQLWWYERLLAARQRLTAWVCRFPPQLRPHLVTLMGLAVAVAFNLAILFSVLALSACGTARSAPAPPALMRLPPIPAALMQPPEAPIPLTPPTPTPPAASR